MTAAQGLMCTANKTKEYIGEASKCKNSSAFHKVSPLLCVFQDGRAPSGVLVCAMFCFCHLFNNPVPAMQLLSAKRPGSGLWPSHRRFATLDMCMHICVRENQKEKTGSVREREKDRELQFGLKRLRKSSYTSSFLCFIRC